MIRSIRHKGLQRLYEDNDPRGVIAEHVVKLRDILARLDAASTAGDMDLPGFRLHPLKGEFKGFWAVTVRPTGGCFSALRTATCWTLIMLIITDGVHTCR
jgi:proteic killer suppression protein